MHCPVPGVLVTEAVTLQSSMLISIFQEQPQVLALEVVLVVKVALVYADHV